MKLNEREQELIDRVKFMLPQMPDNVMKALKEIVDDELQKRRMEK